MTDGAARRDTGPHDTRDHDTGEWVDVGPDGLWRPSVGERLRSLTVLALAIGVLLVLAAVASTGGGGGTADVVVSSTTTTSLVTTTSVATTVIDGTSVDGEAPPLACVFDDRGAAALRPKNQTSVLVLNGTPRTGHAGDVTDQLRAAGYSTIVPGNASIRDRTTVEYVAGHCAEAVQLLDDLGVDSAEIGPIDEGGDVFLGRAEILVTLGRDSL